MNYLEIIGAAIGLIYLWLEYHASIWLWVVGIIMPAIYIIVYFRAGLYADFGINIYYLLAAAYGWIVWKYGKKNKQEKAERPITRTPRLTWLWLLAATAVSFAFIAFILLHTNSTVPYWDSFVTALSIVGMWQLAQKYVEQWLTWITVDAFCCSLYAYKGLPFTAALYGLYTVVAVFGYLKWKKEMNAVAPDDGEASLQPALILANGDFPNSAALKGLLTSSERLICCDGAADHLLQANITPIAIVGDCDSLSTVARKTFADRLHHVAEQETNDLTKAVHFAAEHGWKDITILGATGKREDHTLGNIGLLSHYLDEGLHVRMLTDYGTFLPLRGNNTFAADRGQQISIFNIDCRHLEATGLRYPIRPFKALWEGTLNEATDRSVAFRADGRYLVFISNERKHIVAENQL